MKKRKAYTPRLCGALLEYFGRPAFEERPETVYHPNGEVKQERMVRVARELPTFEAFCWERGVTMETLAAWESEHEEFREACQRARERQRQLLIVNGLMGEYNATFSKFLGCALCGMSATVAEAQEQMPRLIDDL